MKSTFLSLQAALSTASDRTAVKARNGMYLVLPVPFRMMDGKLYVEAQAANGLDRWADNFSLVTIAAPLIPEEQAAKLSGFVWRAADLLDHRDRIVCQPLPWAYSYLSFAKAWSSTRAGLAASIQSAEYLQFAISTLVGDWALVAALEAMQQGRRYAIHTDRVEHELIIKMQKKQSGPRRWRALIEVALMKRSHRHVIRHASLGLWHGEDCFRGYSPWCRENHLIHDIHTKDEDRIADPILREKLADVYTAKELRLCYAGRLDPIKAPLEWLRAIACARERGARVRATWFGEGPVLEEAKAETARLNLQDVVSYPGFVASRSDLLRELRSSHAMIFTHITPESPRTLLESLVSGTPILGYDIPYASDLIAEQGGGVLVPMHDAGKLGSVIVELD